MGDGIVGFVIVAEGLKPKHQAAFALPLFWHTPIPGAPPIGINLKELEPVCAAYIDVVWSLTIPQLGD
jgi:hypothetical protein